MSSALTRHALKSLTATVALCAAALATPAPAVADSPFISQIPKGVTLDLGPNPGRVLTAPPSVSAPSFSSNFALPPQFAVPPAPKGNVATTVEIGNENSVFQVQTGKNDQSAVGIIGDSNGVGVIQAGSNLQSNIQLIGTKGVGVLALQGQGSAPINMAIIHVPHGTVIIPH